MFKIQSDNLKRSDSDSPFKETNGNEKNHNNKHTKFLHNLNLKNISTKASQIYQEMEKNKYQKKAFNANQTNEKELNSSLERKMIDSPKYSKNYKERIKDIENQIREKYIREKDKNTNKIENDSVNSIKKGIIKIQDNKLTLNILQKTNKQWNNDANYTQNADNFKKNNKLDFAENKILNYNTNNEQKNLEINKSIEKANENNNLKDYLFKTDDINPIYNHSEIIGSNNLNKYINRNFIGNNKNNQNNNADINDKICNLLNNYSNIDRKDEKVFINSVDNYRKLIKNHEIYNKIKEKSLFDEKISYKEKNNKNNHINLNVSNSPNNYNSNPKNVLFNSEKTTGNKDQLNEKMQKINETISRLSENIYDKINSLNMKLQEEKERGIQNKDGKTRLTRKKADEEKVKDLILGVKEKINQKQSGNNNNLLNSEKLTPDFNENKKKFPEFKSRILSPINVLENMDNYSKDIRESGSNSLSQTLISKKYNLTEKNVFSTDNLQKEIFINHNSNPLKFIYDSENKLLTSHLISNKNKFETEDKFGHFSSYLNCSNYRRFECLMNKNKSNNNEIENKNQINSDFKNYENLKFSKMNDSRIGKVNSKKFLSKTLNNYAIESDIEDVTESILNFRLDVSTSNIDSINHNNYEESCFDKNQNEFYKFSNDNNSKFILRDANKNYNVHSNGINDLNNHYQKFKNEKNLIPKNQTIYNEQENLIKNENTRNFNNVSEDINNSIIAVKANEFINAFEDINQQKKFNNVIEKNHENSYINYSIENSNLHIINERKTEYCFGNKKSNFDNGESIEYLKKEDKIDKKDIIDIESINNQFRLKKDTVINNEKLRLRELESYNVINIEMLSSDKKYKIKPESRKKVGLDLCHETNIEIVGCVDKNETNFSYREINEVGNHTDKDNFRPNNHLKNNILLQETSTCYIEKSGFTKDKENKSISESKKSDKRDQNLDVSKNNSFEILPGNDNIYLDSYKNYDEIKGFNSKKHISNSIKLNNYCNDHTRNTNSLFNFKVIADKRKLSDININDHFNFTSSSLMNLNKFVLENINNSKKNCNNYENGENSNSHLFKPYELNKELIGNSGCINNTYNYKTEINIGNNRYDDSPTQTLSKILKRYKANTEKKSKEHSRLLKDFKKFQEDEEFKELELSISNLSISVEKNKNLNTLNNSKLSCSRKNSGFKVKSRSKSRSGKDSLIFEKSFESQNNEYEYEITKRNSKDISEIKSNKKKIDEINKTSENKENKNSEQITVSNIKEFSLTKEKLRDLITSSKLNEFEEKCQNSNENKIKKEEKEELKLSNLNPQKSDQPDENEDKLDEHDLFIRNLKSKIYGPQSNLNEIPKVVAKNDLEDNQNNFKGKKIEVNGLNIYEQYSNSIRKNITDFSKQDEFQTPNFDLKPNNIQDSKIFVNKKLNPFNDKFDTCNVSEFNIEKEMNQESKVGINEELSNRDTRNKYCIKKLNNFDSSNINQDASDFYDSTNQSKSKKRVSFSNNHFVHTYSCDGKNKSNKDLMKILKANKNKKIKSILKKNISKTEDIKKYNTEDFINKCASDMKEYNTSDKKGHGTIKENGSSDLDKDKEISKQIALDKLNDLIKECEIDSPFQDKIENKTDIMHLQDSIHISSNYFDSKVHRKINFNKIESEMIGNEICIKEMKKNEISVSYSSDSCNSHIINNKNTFNLEKNMRESNIGKLINNTTSLVNKEKSNDHITNEEDIINSPTNNSFIKINYRVKNCKERACENIHEELDSPNKKNKIYDSNYDFSDLSENGNKSDLAKISINKKAERYMPFKKNNFTENLNCKIKKNQASIISDKKENNCLNGKTNISTNTNKIIYQKYNPLKNTPENRTNKSSNEKIKTPDKIFKNSALIVNYNIGSSQLKNQLNLSNNDLCNETVSSIKGKSKSPVSIKKNINEKKNNTTISMKNDYLITNTSKNSEIKKSYLKNHGISFIGDFSSNKSNSNININSSKNVSRNNNNLSGITDFDHNK